jgi:hypothetical protein
MRPSTKGNMKSMSTPWVLFIGAWLGLQAGLSGATFMTGAPANKGTTIKSDATLGYAFRVGADSLRVLQLGLWDQGADGLTESHQVGIWNSNGELLASTTVNSGTSGELAGNFRYANLLEGLMLDANTVYVIAARFYNVDNSDAYITGNYTIGPGVSWDDSKDRYSADYSGFVFPLNTEDGAANVGPNFIYDVVPVVVPEPDTLILFTGGSLMLFMLRRCNKTIAREARPRKGGQGKP